MKKVTIQITDADYFYLQAKYGKVSSFLWENEVRLAIRKNILRDHTSGKFTDLTTYNREDIPKGQEWYVGAMIHDSNFYQGGFDTKDDYDEFNKGFDDEDDYYVRSD